MSFTMVETSLLDVPILVVGPYFYCALIDVLIVRDSDLNTIIDTGVNLLFEECEYMTKKEKKTAKMLIKEIRDTGELPSDFWYTPEFKQVFIKLLRLGIRFARDVKDKEEIDKLFGNKLEELTDMFKDEPEQKYLNMCNNMKNLKSLVDDLLFREFCICNMVGKMEDANLNIMFLPCGFN